MTQYRIASDRVSIGKKGATVAAEDLEGLNVDALISGGHLEVVSAPAKTKTTDNTEEK